jgi:hypothetical protein
VTARRLGALKSYGPDRIAAVVCIVPGSAQPEIWSRAELLAFLHLGGQVVVVAGNDQADVVLGSGEAPTLAAPFRDGRDLFHAIRHL